MKAAMPQETSHTLRARGTVSAEIRVGSAGLLPEGCPRLQTRPTGLIEVVARATAEATNGPTPVPP